MPLDQPRTSAGLPVRSLAPTLDRDAIIAEVKSGLRNEKDRIANAQENAIFADLEGEYYLEKREAETEFDFAGRLKLTTGFMHQAVNRLCQNMYNPGPERTISDDEAADELLKRVYGQVHIDCVMNEAERLSTVSDVCCIEVKATDDPDQPIDLQIWGSDEFAVFLDPDDQRKPLAVVIIDRVDERCRYRLWFADEVYEFRTEKLEQGRTSGGVIAEQWGDPEPNTYGCLPFSFVGYRSPIRRFWTPGPGTFLRSGENNANGCISELAEGIQKYGKPIGWFKNVSAEFNPEIGPGRFLRLNKADAGDPEYGGGEPDAGYLQAQLAIAETWGHIKEYLGQLAEAIDLPPSALRLDYTDAPSGISIVIRSAPLLGRARQRRPIYQWAETELARTILRVYAAWYGDAAIARSAKTLQLLLAWPEPRIPIPGPERDESDGWEMSIGIKDRVQVLMERYGLSEPQAIKHITDLAAREKKMLAILPQAQQPAQIEGEKERGQPKDDDDPEPEEQE